MSPPWRHLSSHKFPLYFLSLRLQVHAQVLQHPRHRPTWAQAGFQQRGTRIGVGVPDSDGLLHDVTYKLSPACGALSTPCWLAAGRGYARPPPTALVQWVPTASGAPRQPVLPPSGRATPRASGEPALICGPGTSRSKGGVPFWAALHRGGTWSPVPCPPGMINAPGQSSLGCCPCGAP